MARLARADVFDPHKVSVFHCIQRCVRRCFLCGDDPYTGRNFDHRKAWLEERLRYLARWFGTQSDLGTIANDPRKLAEIRERLSHISWFMRMIAGPLARRANREDQTTGRFWQGRFKGVKLCDDAAILGCSIYVDLNVIRAGLARTPETSDFTSAQRRIQALDQQDTPTEDKHPELSIGVRCPDDWLAPLFLDEGADPGPMPHQAGMRCSDKGFLPISVSEYLELLDWSGRQIVEGKRGAIPDHLAPILERVGIPPDGWLTLALEFGRLFQRVAGSCGAVNGECNLRTGRPFRRGPASLLGRGPSVTA